MIQNLTDWYTSLDSTLQVFWACAAVGTFVFLIQAILTLVGIGDADVDLDFEGGDLSTGDTMDLGGSLSLFSARNIINFLVGFGWAGVCLYKLLGGGVLLYLASTAIGVLFVMMYFLIKKQTKRLESNGAYDIKDCVGKDADVYLRIPADMAGKGKIQISINGSVHELDAMTRGDKLPTGCRVRITDITDSNILLVDKI